jgi:hypothetical protein
MTTMDRAQCIHEWCIVTAFYLVCPSHPWHAPSISPSMPRVIDGIRPYALYQVHLECDNAIASIFGVTHRSISVISIWALPAMPGRDGHIAGS